MTARPPLTAGDAMARRRLGMYARLAALLAEQEEALAEDDLERFQALTREVATLRSSLGGGALEGGGEGQGAPGEDTGGASREEGAGLPDGAVAEIVAEALASNRRIQARLADMRRATALQLRTLRAGRARGRTYLEAGQGRAAADGRVDVKL